MGTQFIFERAPFTSCHASTLVETEPGKLLAAWFGGSDEGRSDVCIWIARYDGQKWSAPEKGAEERGHPCWNPVLMRERSNGEITLYYKAGPNPSGWSGFFKRSQDGGRTFGDGYILPAGLLGPIKNKSTQLADGTILAPTSVEAYKNWAAWIERSTDRGRTWTRHGPITHPEQPYGVIQPTILKRRDGSLLALMRSRNIGMICQSTSSDAGKTWTPAAPIEALPNPNSGIDAVTLADGRHALVYNPSHVERTPLVVSLSADDGATWQRHTTLEESPGEYSYPAIIQVAEGALHVTYTWRRERIAHAVIKV